jgi:hypothetical protein
MAQSHLKVNRIEPYRVEARRARTSGVLIQDEIILGVISVRRKPKKPQKIWKPI